MKGGKVHAAKSRLSHDVDNVLFEILLRLPSKSLMRFKSVCKSWLALISSRYFCLLWQQHHNHGPGILLTSLRFRKQQHCYVPLSGPTYTAGMPRFELPRRVQFVLQSCNGFLLCCTQYGLNPRRLKFWVYNPATLETFRLPPARLDACKIHSRRCTCRVSIPVLAFDSLPGGRMVTLSTHQSKRSQAYIHQVCVSENQGAWRSSSKRIVSQRPLGAGLHWRRFVVWLSPDKTLFYHVRGQRLRFRDPPRFSKKQVFYTPEGPYSYRLEVSGGHLHFIHIEGSRVIIDEMKNNLSGWFVKHKIELSQIEASLVRSIGWDVNGDLKFKINFVMEDEEDPKLVLGCRHDVVMYRIQDHKSWKLCEWKITGGGPLFPHEYFHKMFAHQHVENISRFRGHQY